MSSTADALRGAMPTPAQSSEAATAAFVPKLHVRNLNFYYGSFLALKNVNMDVPEHLVHRFGPILAPRIPSDSCRRQGRELSKPMDRPLGHGLPSSGSTSTSTDEGHRGEHPTLDYF